MGLFLFVYSRFRRDLFEDELGILGMFDKALFTIGPVLYVPFSQTTLQLFDCTRLPNGKYVLDADQGTRCFSGGWWEVFPLGAIAICVCVLGIPVYFGVRLFRNRDHLLEP